MNLIDMLIYVVIGLVVLGVIVAFVSVKFNKAGKIEDDLINKTLEDPFSITGDSVKENDLSSSKEQYAYKMLSSNFPIHKYINKFSVL